MAVIQLSQEEQLLLSEKVQKLTELNQKAIALNAKAYRYDWVQLDQFLKNAILEYQNILNFTEAVK